MLADWYSWQTSPGKMYSANDTFLVSLSLHYIMQLALSCIALVAKHLYTWASLTTTSASERRHEQMRVSYNCCRMFSARIHARYIYIACDNTFAECSYKIFYVDGRAHDYYCSLSQPLCCLQIQKTWQWNPINGYSSAVQPVVITLLDGTWQVILIPSNTIHLYLAC